MRTDITAIIHDAMEAHVPGIPDENSRQEALAYLRGLKAILATRSSAAVASGPSTSPRTRLRIEQVISKCRQTAIADALKIHRHALAKSSNHGALRPEGWGSKSHQIPTDTHRPAETSEEEIGKSICKK